MKILHINSLCDSGSTGRICVGISEYLQSKDNFISSIIYFWGKKNKKGLKISNTFYQKIQALKSRVFGNYGNNSKLNSLKLILKIKKINPDLIHLHNIHDHTIDIATLFKFLNKSKKKVLWTFHDCWAFTGYCPNFSAIECHKWKTECIKCPVYKKYSWFWDRSNSLFKMKKRLFSKLDLSIVTPSKWLKDVVKDSFLKDKPTFVINNGIDLNIFKPVITNFRYKYSIENKILLLGVAYKWTNKKGIDVFLELERKLPNSFQIVLVGTDSEIDKKLPNSIISIHRTDSVEELVEIYSAADFFINPTREEILGMVNIEALACGTPVIVFNTDGAPECVDNSCGIVIEKNNIDELISNIINCSKNKYFSVENCRKFAKKFNYKIKYEEYYKLYLKILGGK